MRPKYKRVVYAEKAKYLDPLHCGSFIGYRIKSPWNGNGVEGIIDLSDCSRKIEWSFDDNETRLQKIGNAIDMLLSFKEDLIRAIKIAPKRRKKIR
jgi:hypothetical protein